MLFVKGWSIITIGTIETFGGGFVVVFGGKEFILVGIAPLFTKFKVVIVCQIGACVFTNVINRQSVKRVAGMEPFITIEIENLNIKVAIESICGDNIIGFNIL